jgi:hypothetical protein
MRSSSANRGRFRAPGRSRALSRSNSQPVSPAVPCPVPALLSRRIPSAFLFLEDFNFSPFRK